MTGTRFANSFWDDDDRGVDVIADKLELSKQTCDEIRKLYEIRAQIEEDYGERLLKLSQMEVGRAEQGTLAESVSHIPSAIEITARAHVDLANQLRQHLQAPLDGFTNDQREKRKAQSQQVENSKQLRSMHYANVMKTRDLYMAESTKLTGMEKYITERHHELSPGEVHQIEEEIEEQKKLVVAAASTSEHTCDVYQELEESRINFIRSSLWAFANMMSSVYIVDDQCCERIRSALELTDVDKDIKSFIDKYGTGSKVTAMMSYEDPMNISNGVTTDRGPQPPPPTMSLPPVPSALPNPPANATTTDIDTSKPPPTRAYSDDPVSREQNDHKSVGRPLSDSQVREPPQQTYGTIPTMSMHEDESKRGSTSLSSYAHNRESALDSLHGFEFVEYAQPLEEEHHSGNRTSVQSRDQHQQPDTMSFAFKEIEKKPTDKAAAAPEAPIMARTMSPPPIAHNDASPTTSPLQNAPPMAASISTPTETPAPREPIVTSPQQQPQDVINSRPQSSVERAISPPPVLAASSMSKPTRNGSDISDKSSNSNNLRFKPIPNPSYDGPKRPSSTESATARSPDNNVTTAGGATDMRAPSPAKGPPKLQQNIPTPGEDEEESEDEFPPLVRPKPREEKWMISSIRRPQQLPVRTQNARIYDRQSTIPTLGGGMHPPELKIDTSMGQPPQPSAAAGAAHQALETVRAQLQRHASSPTPTDLSATAAEQTAGIRAAPWQQQQQQQPLSMAPPEPRSDYYSTGGLGRQNSVNGPRPESRQHLTPVPGDDYMIPTSSSMQQQPPQTQPYNVVPPQQQASYPPPQQQQQQQQQQAPQPKPSQSQNTKEKSGGRFSLAIFGKKRGKEDENIPEVPKMPTSSSQSEKRQPQQSPLPPPQENRSSMRDNRLSDGMPILGYVRALWGYEAKIETEMSFKAGDTFAVIHKQPDGWWEAELLDPSRRTRALIPGNYMEALQQ
ncbi:cell division control protein [Lichtheimia corymbifera JMRC:FSU:9682]|uniref:Cell division control protein n=1 Tax=Lichtheimia corymbifera JMRC:FSU:9682 TaxID=1263082 RepID=A0A068RLX7_9FUNG|nr:cell division control protein [Lichtheimia corymbifera JMRC:FSU:9682]